MVFPERLGAFRFWCQKVLPLVYDDSLSYYELLCKVVKYLNDTMQAVNDLTDVVEDFLDSGEFTQAIEDKLDEMAEDGTLAELINQEVFGEINEELADLNTRVDSLDDKSWVIFGDSYGESSSGFIDLCGTALGYDSDHWRKYAPSGYGFSGGVGAWYNLVTTAGSALSSDVQNAVTDVLFIGGMNDGVRYANGSVSIADLQSYRNMAFTNAKTVFPNAKIHVSFIGYTKQGAQVTPFCAVLQDVYKDSASLGVDYWDGLENVMMLRSNRGDVNNDHPSSAGQDELAKYMAECVLKGSCDVYYRAKTAGADNSIFTTKPATNMSLYNGIIHYVMGLGNRTLTEAIDSIVANGTEANKVKLFDLSGSNLIGIFTSDETRSIQIASPCIVRSNEGDGVHFTLVPFAWLEIDSGSVYLHLKHLNDAGSDYFTFQSVTQLQFQTYVSFDIPAWV